MELMKIDFNRSVANKIFFLCHDWLFHFTAVTQIHGIKWYTLAPNLLFRLFFLLFFLTFIIAVPIYFVNEGFLLYRSRSLNKKIEWKREAALTYPNLTVCYPKFFDQDKLKGFQKELTLNDSLKRIY